MEYYAAKQRVGDVDPTHHIIEDLFKKRKPDTEQKYWVAFLYATLYSPHRLIATWNEFPEFYSISNQDWIVWEKDMYAKQGLDPDRIKCMRPPILDNILTEYTRLLRGRSQEQFFESLIDADRPKASFHRITKKLRTIPGVGRHIAYAWTEIMIRCLKLPIRCDTIFPKEAKSSREGLFEVVGECAEPDREVKRLMQTIKSYYEVPVDFQYMETVLCQFKSYLKGKRKVGYYLDEQAGNLVRGALAYPHIDWEEIWAMRATHTTKEHLWENRKPLELLHKPGFIDAVTQTWLKKNDNKRRVKRYLLGRR